MEDRNWLNNNSFFRFSAYKSRVARDLLGIAVFFIFSLAAFGTASFSKDPQSVNDAMLAGFTLLGSSILLVVLYFNLPFLIKKEKARLKKKIIANLEVREIDNNLYELAYKGYTIVITHFIDIHIGNKNSNRHELDCYIEIPTSQIAKVQSQESLILKSVGSKTYIVYKYPLFFTLTKKKFFKELDIVISDKDKIWLKEQLS